MSSDPARHDDRRVADVVSAVGFDGKPRNRRKTSGNRTPQRRQLVAERRVRVSAMLVSRMTLREIARVEDVAPSTIADDVRVIQAAWRERAAQTYDVVVAEELAKLDAMERGIAPSAQLGEVQAIDRMLRIADRRAKLLGLDAPERIDARVLHADVGPSAAEQLAQLDEGAQDERALGIAAVLADALGLDRATGDVIDVESSEHPADDHDTEADAVHQAGADDQASRVPPARSA